MTLPAPVPSDGTEIVFADLDDGRVLHRVQRPLAAGAGNFSPDGRLHASAGSTAARIIDVATGTFVGPEDPVHSGPVAWVTFSPDGATLATLGFDGELALVDPATVLPAPVPNLARQRRCVGRLPSRRRLRPRRLRGRLRPPVRHRPGGLDRARLPGRRTKPHRDEWRDAFGDRPYRETCPTT